MAGTELRKIEGTRASALSGESVGQPGSEIQGGSNGPAWFTEMQTKKVPGLSERDRCD
jgi:hypothetical protein